MKKRIISLILLLFSLFFVASCNLGSDYNVSNDNVAQAVNAISEKYMLCNVKIETRIRSGVSTITEIGSGAIIKKKKGITKNEYWLVTNNHVVAKTDFDSRVVSVYDMYGNYYSADEVIAAESEYDLALVHFSVEGKNSELEAIAVSDSQTEKGEYVYSVGNPGSQFNSITVGKSFGEVSPPAVNDESNKISFKVIKHSAKISEGSSGGMLLRCVGGICELVGVNYCGIKESDNGYAIPAAKIKEFLAKHSIEV